MKVVRKNFWKYISFGVFGMLGSSGTILADTFFVSNRLRAEGLAALNIAIAVFGLINGLGMMLGIGGATRYTICRSRKQYQEADQTFTLAFFSALGIGLLFLLAGIYGASRIAGFLGADSELLPLCAVYLRTVLCFAPCFILNHLFMAFIRNDGGPRLSMSIMIAGSLANIVLDYTFMYPLNMGIFGAALATGLSPVIGLGTASLHLLAGRNGFHFRRVKPGFSKLKYMAEPGIASFVNEFSSSVVLVVFNLLIMKFAGNTGVAAYGIVANLALIVLAVFTGISQGLQPLLSRAYGRGNSGEVRYLYQKGRLLAFLTGLAVLTAVYFFSAELVSLFNSGNDYHLQFLAEEGMKYYFVGFLFLGYNYVTISLFSTTSRSGSAFGMSFFRGCAGIIAAAYLLSAFWGIQGVWLAFPVVELMTMLIGLMQTGNKKDCVPLATVIK